MGVTASQLIGEVHIDGVSQAKADLQSVGDSTNTTGSILKNALGGALGFASNMAGQALGFLKDQMIDSVKVAMAHQDIMAQTAAAIKSTGDASGMSASAIDDLATSLSKTTPFSKDLTDQGENLLLTFTGIGKDVFPQTTAIMDDMAQAMHTGPTQEAMLLGKALNDPTQGLSALTRVGVTFSEQEKTQISTLMAHNNVLGAQKVMLAELQKEFGGSAVAAGKTLGGALSILKNNFEDLKEKVGDAVIPIFSNLVSLVNADVMPLFDKFGGVLHAVAGYFALFDLGAISYQWKQLTETVRSLLGPMDSFGMATKAVSPLLTTLRNDFSQLLDAGIRDVAGIIERVRAEIVGLTSIGGGNSFLGSLIVGFREFAPLVEHAGALLGGELMRELRDVGALAQQVGGWFMSSVVPALRQAEPGFANLAKTVLTTVVPAMIQIRGVVMDVVEHAFKTFGPILEQLVPPLIKFAGLLANDVANGLKFIMPYVQQAATELGKFADEILTRVAPIIKQWLSETEQGLDFFKAHWSEIWGYVGPILKGAWDEIVGIVKIAWAIVSGIIKIGLDLMSGNWSQAWTDLKDMLGGVWDGIRSVISGGLETLNGIFAGLPGKALQWGEDMISGFISGIQNMLGGIGDAVGQVAGVISSHLHFSKPEVGKLADVDQWMPDFMALLSHGMTDNLGQLKSASFTVGATIAGGTGTGLHAVPNVLQGGSSSQMPQIVISPTLTMDGRTLASALMPYIVDAIRANVGVRY